MEHIEIYDGNIYTRNKNTFETMLGNKNKWFGLCMIPAKWANQTVQTAPHKIKRWMQSKLNNWQDFYSLI